jgi:hypothetical protein
MCYERAYCGRTTRRHQSLPIINFNQVDLIQSQRFQITNIYYPIDNGFGTCLRMVLELGLNVMTISVQY